MSRKRVYNINRFDGGMTNDVRNLTDLSKCAFISHFDIYSEPYSMKVMPGYVADQDYEGTPDDLKQFKVRAFHYGENSRLLAVGEKAAGGGTHFVFKNDPTDAEWSNGTATGSGTIEGTDDLIAAPLANIISDSAGDWIVPTQAGGTTYFSHVDNTAVTDKHHTVAVTGSSTGTRFISHLAPNESVYMNLLWDDVGKISGSTVTDPAFNTTMYVTDLASWGDYMWVFGYSFFPYTTRLLLWDLASSNPDQKIAVPNSRGGAIGVVGNSVVCAVDEFVDSSKGATISGEHYNGHAGFSVRQVNGSSLDTLYRYIAPTNTNGALWPCQHTHNDTFLFYGRFPLDSTPTNYMEGIWAVGRRNVNSPLAVSLLMDTSGLGQMDGYFGFGYHHFFAHGGDGSVSRLDDHVSGTFDVTATYESLMFGSDTPYKKQLNGVTVVTEDLPAGATVVLKYRLDTDDSWTTIGTSDTDGKEKHMFTKNIDDFQEIQLRVEVLGKVSVKGIHVSLTETDDLVYE